MQDKANKFRQLLTDDLGPALAYLKASFNLLADNQESLDLLLADHNNWLREELNRTRSYEWLDTERRSLNRRALGLIKLLEDREYHLPSYEEKRFHLLVDNAFAEYSRLENEIPNEQSLRFMAAPVLDGWMDSYLELAKNEQLPLHTTEEILDKQLNELLTRIEAWMQDLKRATASITEAHSKIYRPLEPIEQILTKHPSLGLTENENRFDAVMEKAERLLPGIDLEIEITRAFRSSAYQITTALMQDESARLAKIIKLPNAQPLHRFARQIKRFGELLEPASAAAHQLNLDNMAFRTKLSKLKSRVKEVTFNVPNLLKNIKSQVQ
ncbi:hypothetical protein CEQ90_00950 [Lewinellaceae bacterium SD302]|nr:hypothetical protein CEQ90_00950 [Lewinellaceae bacterium SD302]